MLNGVGSAAGIQGFLDSKKDHVKSVKLVEKYFRQIDKFNGHVQKYRS